MPLVGLLLGFFSSSGPIAAFFVWIGQKVVIKGIILPIQFAVMGALVTAKVAFLIALLTLVLWVYNAIHSFFENLPSLITSSPLLDVSYKLLQSIGFMDAFYNAFSSFTFVWVSLLLLIVSKIAVHSLKDASDEFFKIAILLGA